MRFAILLAGLFFATSAPAAVDMAESRIAFTFVQMKVPLDGVFRRFAANIEFDARQPQRSRVEVEIDLNSIDTGISDADTEAKRKPWFYTAQYPKATFHSSSVRHVAGESYEITGVLSLKGRTRDLVVPVNVKRSGTQTIYKGGFAINRLDFAIGEGPWADTDTVANEVKIRFHIVDTGT